MKNIIITGATGAVGKATAREFAKDRNVNLVLAGRNMNKLQSLKKELQDSGASIDLVELDLGDLSSVRKAVNAVREKHKQIDALVNIAAVYKKERTLNKQGHEAMFATNQLGPFAFTNGLLDLLKNTPHSKVLTVSAPSSTKIDFENINGEKKFSALTAFGASKMMNLLFAFKLAKQFQTGTQASMAFHPGLVKSELLNEGPKLLSAFLKLISSPPEKTARAITQLIDKKDAAALNGQFFDKKLKSLKAAAHAYDQDLQNKLWEHCEKLNAS
jgi:NAD(P)-dependent dehydrogenase (short-subunit alcohol dehydrogenase family)